MNEIDFPRVIIISLASAIAGLILFGLVQAWIDRDLPVPAKRAPYQAIASFGSSYLLVVLVFIADRWESVGNPASWKTWIGGLAIVGNAISLYFMLRYHSTTPSPNDLREAVGWLNKFNRLRFRSLHPGSPLPTLERQQDLIPQMSKKDLQKLIDDVEDEEKPV